MTSKTPKPAIVRTAKSITAFMGGEMHVASDDHPLFSRIVEAIDKEDWDALPDLFTPAKKVEAIIEPAMREEGFTVSGGLIYLEGRPFAPSVSKKALALIAENNDPTPIHNFLRNVRRNPSRVAQEELLLFCAANRFMIDMDGYIVAFKGVRQDFYDQHSGSVLNAPYQNMTDAQRQQLPMFGGDTNEKAVKVEAVNGVTVVSVPRNMVDDRRNVTCSYGLHFGAQEYADSFGSRTLVVRINPADVVSIPSDYGNQKGRCCRYEVIAAIPRHAPLPKGEVTNPRDFVVEAEPGTDEALKDADGAEFATVANALSDSQDVDPLDPAHDSDEWEDEEDEDEEEVSDGGVTPEPGFDFGDEDMEADIQKEEAGKSAPEALAEVSQRGTPDEKVEQAVEQSLRAFYENMSRDALRALCKERGVVTPGKVKGDYVEGLLKSDAEGK